MKAKLKQLVIGTPLESVAHSLARLWPGKRNAEWTLRMERDERHTRRLLRELLREDSNCIDVGANRGHFLRQFVELAPNGTHYAFEPIPELARALRADFPSVEVFNCALSNESGEAGFYYLREDDSWSGLRPQRYPVAAGPVVIEVAVERLDEVIDAEVQVDFIKIDVEGAELEVLQGSESTIKRCRPVILFEHARIHNENYETTPEAVHSFLVDTCALEIWDLALSAEFSREAFRDAYDSAFASGYDRYAQTNFVAR